MIDLKNVKLTKYQSVTLTIVAAAPAGTYSSASADLDDSYDVCDGVIITEISNGGIANGKYDVSVETPSGNPLTQIPIQAVSVTKNDGTSPDKRFLDVLFSAKSGKKAKLLGITPAAPATDLIVQAVFRLRRLIVPIDLPKV